jgi:Peptidase propeptide and YPEB domain
MRWAVVLATYACIALAAKAQDSVIAESTARRIAIEHVQGSTVRTENLDKRTGHPIYIYDLAARGHTNDVAVRIDATDGHILDITPIHSAGDSAAMAAVRKESALKDTAVMPPNTLKDTTAGRTHDSTSHAHDSTPPH